MDAAHDLSVLLGSRHPLLFVEAREEGRLMGVIRQAAEPHGFPLWAWSVTGGLQKVGEETQYGTADLRAALDFIAARDAAGVFVLRDAADHLQDPLARRRLREVAASAPRGQTVVVTGSSLDVPDDLSDVGHRWVLRPPSREELHDIAVRTVRDLRARGTDVTIDREQLDAVVESLRGLTLREAERSLQRAALEDGELGGDDVAQLQLLRAEILNEDGVLELIHGDDHTLDDVGGLHDLKRWLHLRGTVFGGRHDAAETGVRLDSPRGILLTGVPGCGKSMVAKALARSWGVPLVLLDPARIYGKYIGESEQRIDRALRVIDELSPVVLWIDEIEKGFAQGGDGDGGVSRRVLGTFLRWLQDRRSDVFVIATANEVSSLPPELMRRGRFDEIFFVDLPVLDERMAILGHHLISRGQDMAHIDLAAVAAATGGFSGAELETVIVAALYRALGESTYATTETLLDEIARTVPLSIARAEEITALRTWAATRARAA